MPNILSREGNSASIPCLATDPSLENLQLKTCSSKALASGLQFSSSLEQGIIIHNTQKSYEGCYVCTGRLKETNVRSHDYHLTVRPGKKLDDSPWYYRFSLQVRELIAICSISSQFLLVPLQLCCRLPKEWFWSATRACTSPATPPTSMEILTWSGSRRLARWDPSTFYLVCAALSVGLLKWKMA